MNKRSATQARIQIIKAENLKQIPWLIHGFSSRTGGASRCYGGNALNLGYTKEDSRQAVARNRKMFLNELGAPDWPLISVRQIHSDLIRPVSTPSSSNGKPPTEGEPFAAGDGLITDTSGILLSIRTADCYPILLVDVKLRATGVFHAGWRGTLRRIAEKGVGEMARCFGSRREDLRAAIGPGIHGCCYEVGEEVREKFYSQFAYADTLFRESKESEAIHERYPLLFLTARAPGHSEPLLPIKIHLDLAEANRRQLLDAGLKAKQISVSPLCTSCRTDLLFSHRAESGNAGRMMAVAGIRPR